MKVDHGVTISSNLANFFRTSITTFSGKSNRFSAIILIFGGSICRTRRFHAFDVTKDVYMFCLEVATKVNYLVTKNLYITYLCNSIKS